MGDDGDKTPLTPSKGWSPHTAALYRRRKVGEKSKNKVLGSLGGLNLEDEDDDLFLKSPTKSPTKSPNKRTTKPALRQPKFGLGKEDGDEELRLMLEKVTPSVRSKLAKVFNQATPMKDRLSLEVEMMKDPDERKILADFRYKADRKMFNMKILESETAQQELLEKNLSEEAKRRAEEEREFAKKRQERLEEENAKKQRELQLERDAKVHTAKTVAMGAEELRKDAERTAEAAARNKAKKDQEEREREARIKAFLEGEGKTMTDVERELKLARMLNNGDI